MIARDPAIEQIQLSCQDCGEQETFGPKDFARTGVVKRREVKRVRVFLTRHLGHALVENQKVSYSPQSWQRASCIPRSGIST